MGVLYARVGGAWVAIAGSSPPAPASAAAQGLLYRYTKPSSQGGFGSTEFTIDGLNGVLANSVAGRYTQVRYGLEFPSLTLPAANSYYVTRLRLGATTAGAQLDAHIHSMVPGQQNWGPGYITVQGAFLAQGFAAGATVSLTMVAYGGISFTIGNFSYVEMIDLGAA